jgi:hypothetical protein
MASLSLNAGPRINQPSRRRSSMLLRSRKSIPWKNTSCSWFWRTKHFLPTLWTLLISMKARTPWQNAQRKFKVMPTSSRLALVWVAIWFARSKHQHFRVQSRSTSQWTIWLRERKSQPSAKCSKAVRIRSSHSRFVLLHQFSLFISNISLQEYYIPAESSSIHFLRSTLCVGCARGFEVVSLETTETQSLLDQADTSLDFVARKENVKPIHIERMNGEFLLNYSDFSFFVNRNGWRARPDWRIAWEGNPNAFALSYPYILAFEPNFVEIRHVETSELTHLMTGKNIRMLHSSTREVNYIHIYFSLPTDANLIF